MRPGQRYCLLTFVIAGAASADEPAFQRATTPMEFHIAAEPVGQAMQDWADATGLDFLMTSKLGKGVRSAEVTGLYTPAHALDALLVNTGLTYSQIDATTVEIRLPSESFTPADLAKSRKSASADTVVHTTNEIPLQTVLITGSHIPGTASTSPVRIYNRDEIDHSGAANTEQFLSVITQNYGSGPSEYSTLRTLGVGPAQTNPGFGTGANLRGLGSPATLILVDGHRLAPSGYADFTDVSMIPFEAIERVEVLTDGASAVYGSDAVGGVVNFIMSHDHTKRESSLLLGGSTHGDSREYAASQTYGFQWGSGGGTVSLQTRGRDAISNQSRDFSLRDLTAPFYGPRDLLPEMQSNAAYVSLDHRLSEAIELDGQGIFASRHEIYHGCTTPCGPSAIGNSYDLHASNEEYEIWLRMRAPINSRWTIEMDADGSQNALNSNQTATSKGTAVTDTGSNLWSVAASSTGTLLTWYAGDIKASGGISFRNEGFRISNPAGGSHSHSGVRAGYTELQIPLVGPEEVGGTDPRLLLTVAGRYEHYSTFGSTFNPKAGIRLVPLSSLSVRGTFSSAFRAPTAYQLSDFNSGRYLVTVADAGPATQDVRALVRYGGNPDVHQQKADIWTLGFDWTLTSPDLQFSATYFDINYKHIIWDASTVPLSLMLSNPAYSAYIEGRGETPDSRFNSAAESLMGDSRLQGCMPPSDFKCAEPVSNITAIVDQREANLASSQTSGIDWSASDTLQSPWGRLNVGMEATHVFNYRQRVTPTSATEQVAGTAGDPPRLQLRSYIQWERGHWFGGSTFHFTSGGTTRGSLDPMGNELPLVSIASWSTFDFQLGYRPINPKQTGAFAGVSVTLDIKNMFDQQPPPVRDQAYGFGYDPSNANPFGRRISLQFRKRW